MTRLQALRRITSRAALLNHHPSSAAALTSRVIHGSSPANNMSGPWQSSNPSVASLKPSATLLINEVSNELQRKGEKVFKFGLGQSPFPVPDVVVSSLSAHANEKDYLPVEGLGELRAAIAEHQHRFWNTEYTANDIFVGPGSKELLFTLQYCYQGELLLPSPSWVSYSPQSAIARTSTAWLNTTAEEGWKLRAEVLDRHCRKAPHKPRIMVLNSPSNPTGAVLSADELQEIAEVCRRYRVLVVSDEIYSLVGYDGPAPSLATYYPEGTVVNTGLSKWCGAGGWRLGCMMLPRGLKEVQAMMKAMASETFSAVSAPTQFAAVTAYSPSQEIDDYLERSRKILKATASYTADVLLQAGIQTIPASGGFYLTLNFCGKAREISARAVERGLIAHWTEMNDEVMAELILRETGVASVSGSHFGLPRNGFHTRIAFVDFDGATALKCVSIDSSATANVSDFVSMACPRVFEGAHSLADWYVSL